ncbi:MAG: hypothetical protein MUP99_14660 [Pedobacter sp.]|nr:hypothetical protein [Pedobacter sp.]
MEPYEIEVATGGLSITYTVQQEEDGQFKIMQDEEVLGKIYPDVLENGVTWNTSDDIDELLLNSIGQAIEAQEGM